MRNWVLLFGLAFVLAALLMACGQALLADHVARANSALAGGVFSIPLAAAIEV